MTDCLRCGDTVLSLTKALCNDCLDWAKAVPPEAWVRALSDCKTQPDERCFGDDKRGEHARQRLHAINQRIDVMLDFSVTLPALIARLTQVETDLETYDSDDYKNLFLGRHNLELAGLALTDPTLLACVQLEAAEQHLTRFLTDPDIKDFNECPAIDQIRTEIQAILAALDAEVTKPPGHGATPP